MAHQNQRIRKPTTPWWEIIFIGILLFYPLRHIHWGLDLWDTGYNYANFQYMGLDHMDSMWLFSTYLATAAGHILTLLPFGDCLMGMNFYTGLLVSALSLLGYFFCVKKLGMPKWTAFMGELAAISLCWCPTALLYNYLTYVLFLVCVILLYQGLTKEKHWNLFAAGVCLGANVLVRFSNLPEAAMILAVWAYAVISVGEGAKKGKESRERASGHERKGLISRMLCQAGRDTLWCMGGYFTALLVLLGYIHIRYGLDNYIEGIKRLFAMTDNATDYKATAMLVNMLYQYWENLYWVARIGVIAVMGTLSLAVINNIRYPMRGRGIHTALKVLAWLAAVAVSAGLCWYISSMMYKGYDNGIDPVRYPGIRVWVLAVCWAVRIGMITVACTQGLAIMMYLYVKLSGREDGLKKYSMRYEKYRDIICRIWKAVWCMMMVLMMVWLFCRTSSTMYYSYDPIRRPGILFLMLAMGIGTIRIFHKHAPKEEKLISGMVILVILLTSIGSNNDVYPSLNNLFVAAPYTLWQCWRFSRQTAKGVSLHGTVYSVFPLKAVIITFLLLFLVQSGIFGSRFVFAEATGVQDVSATVEHNEVLRGIKMNPQRAGWMQEITDYAKDNGLTGREVILYGNLPALSYYLQMPSAFNPWSDLVSYSYETFAADLRRTEESLGERDRPVILLEDRYALYREKGKGGLEAAGISQENIQEITEDAKWQLLMDFMEKYGYEQTFRNEKFGIWE